MYLEKINEDGDVTGRTVVGIVSGGIGCGSSKKPNFPKWWARVRKSNMHQNYQAITPKVIETGIILLMDLSL